MSGSWSSRAASSAGGAAVRDSIRATGSVRVAPGLACSSECRTAARREPRHRSGQRPIGAQSWGGDSSDEWGREIDPLRVDAKALNIVALSQHPGRGPATCHPIEIKILLAIPKPLPASPGIAPEALLAASSDPHADPGADGRLRPRGACREPGASGRAPARTARGADTLASSPPTGLQEGRLPHRRRTSRRVLYGCRPARLDFVKRASPSPWCRNVTHIRSRDRLI
jgi:hypothetical protein